jgi:prepilin-type N-terminal cleavage/methylation domain-containing protein
MRYINLKKFTPCERSDTSGLKTNKGFSLIELLLYISISAILLLAVSSFLGILLQARVKNQTIAEVEQQGAQIIQLVTQSIRNAKSINSPATSTTSSLLSLDVTNSADNPTIFDLANSAFRITEGASSPILLTNSRVAVSSLEFHNLSRADTAGVVRIKFNISHINPEGRNEYDYSRMFFASASLRGGSESVTQPAPASDQADDLTVDISGANIGGGGNKELRGITVENTGTGSVTIDKITLTWTNGQLIEEIKIDNVRVWKHNNEGLPDGRQPTGTEIDIVDHIIASGVTDTVNKFKFNGNMTGDTFTITFTMGDSSTKVISSFSP